ncbi:DUF6353 family protein [Lachnospiraceae bacterium 29-84]
MKKHKLMLYLKRYTPTILTYLSAVGVAVTAAMAVKASPKAIHLIDEMADKKERSLTRLEIAYAVLPAYVPAIAVGLSTVACMFGANILNKRQQASLASAYAVLCNYHKEYRRKLVELSGEETDIEIRNAIVRGQCNYHPVGIDVPDEKSIFYEEISGESITCYEKEIMDAEYHLNRNFVLRGYVSLNEFYGLLGLPKTDYGESVGWSMADGYCWIDFEHRLVSRDDGGSDVYVIDILFPPDAGYLDM